MNQLVKKDEQLLVAERKRGWRRPDLIEINKRRTVHGMTNTPEHKAWRQMISRCSNKNNPAFHNYGGRGISVGKEWGTFKAFFADMGHRPSASHTIERNDTNRGYCKENCHWATRSEQSLNTRKARWWTIGGNTYDSGYNAAIALHVDQATIVRWCNGYRVSGVMRPAKNECSSSLKYPRSRHE